MRFNNTFYLAFVLLVTGRTGKDRQKQALKELSLNSRLYKYISGGLKMSQLQGQSSSHYYLRFSTYIDLSALLFAIFE